MKRMLLSYDDYRCRMLSFVFVMLIPVTVLLFGATAYMKTTAHVPKQTSIKPLRELPVAKTVTHPAVKSAR